MKHQGKISGELLNRIQGLEAQSLPVGGIFAMDIADAGCQEVHAQIGDGLALLGIRALAHAYYTVFLSADGAHLGLDGDALAVSGSYQLRGLGNVLVDGIMRAVEHDG